MIKKFYMKNVMFGAILLVLGTAMVLGTTISAPVPAAAARPPTEPGCNADLEGDRSGPPVIVNEGKHHQTTNENGHHNGCHGQAENPPTSGGANVIKQGDCTGVATPSGNGNIVCNRNDNNRN
jgi:hypothetical protein